MMVLVVVGLGIFNYKAETVVVHNPLDENKVEVEPKRSG